MRGTLSCERAVSHQLDQIVSEVAGYDPNADLALVRRAYEFASQAHAGQTRKSGDPYVTHPISVARIIAELKLDVSSICAGLLHDCVEDTSATVEQLSETFGKEIAYLVDGVTKLGKLPYSTREEQQAENFRKMLLAMARDIRVILVKLCDRLDNMRSLNHLPPEKQERIAAETMQIYAPLANRLGIQWVKIELEDLSFKYLYPGEYDQLAAEIAKTRAERLEYIHHVEKLIEKVMGDNGVPSEVTGRAKHLWSIYSKMKRTQRPFDEIHDAIGFRVVTDNQMHCYQALGVAHSTWTPIPGRFKDYIATPKFNLYQSLHTTVIGPGGKPVEIQIRTHTMHRRAEYGVAAHWKYKEDGKPGTPTDRDDDPSNDMAWLKQLLDWQKETEDPGEFLDSLRFEMNGGEVYVFTPKGEVVSLPAGSTPVDFAYAVHTEVGHHTIGGRVNGRLVPLESTLENGDVVEVLTSKADGAGPSRDWLGFVKSARARNKIRAWFSKERREEAIDSGKEAIAKAMRKQGLPLQRLMTADGLTVIATDLRHTDIDGLYAAVGEGHISAQHVVERLVTSLGGEEGASEDLAEATMPTKTRARRGGDPGVVVVGTADVWVKLAKCCTPVPGDPILGFVTRGSGVSVHRRDCTNIESLLAQPDRLIDVEWAPSSSSVFLVQLQVEALDRSRLLSDVTRVLSDQHVNILSASVQTSRDRVALSRFTFEMGEPSHLDHVIRAVRRIDGVFDVYRITGGKVTAPATP